MDARQDSHGGRHLVSRAGAWVRRKAGVTAASVGHSPGSQGAASPGVGGHPSDGAPTKLQRRARAALAEGRKAEAARLLAKTDPRWRRRPEAWQWVADSAPAETVIPVALRLYREGCYEFAAGILTRTNLEVMAPEQRRPVGRALIHGHQLEVAIPYLEKLVASERDPDQLDPDEELRRDKKLLELAQFYLPANEYLGKFTSPRPEDVQGFVIVYNWHAHVVAALMVPMTGVLMDQGYPVKTVLAGTVTTPKTGIPTFDSLEGCIAPGGSNLVREPEALAHDWTIDWPAGVVETGGINYYTYFQERFARWARVYRADSLDYPEAAERFDALLQRSDVALSLCERALALAKEQGKPVRIAIHESHFAPSGIIREWCEQVGSHHGVHAVALSIGYENYYSNLTSLQATTVAVEDLTANPTVRQPFLGGLHRLEAALREDPSLGNDPDDEVLSWIVQDRSKVELSSQAGRDAVMDQVERTHSAGGQVFVVLGKVVVDFAAPGDRGFVHADFVEWVNHLVEAVTDTGNLLLIKPHPHELRAEVVQEDVQRFRDLVTPHLPENVVFLDHNTFNTHELAEVVDAAFLWNGTAILEFSVLGVPVVPASVWAERDYPVGFEVLGTRGDYDQVLRGERVLSVAPDAARRSAAMLRLMRSDFVAIPYTYVRRSATNLDFPAPVLDVAMLERMAEQPDPYVERAASRFFEFA
jgi:tetratricopeptide (TPR) repeat protein